MDSITPQFSSHEILGFLQQYYHLEGVLKPLPGYIDQNFLLNSRHSTGELSGAKFIVKIANAEEPAVELEMQNEAMQHLNNKGINVPVVIRNKEQLAITTIQKTNGQKFSLRVLSYLEGAFYADAKPELHSEPLWESLGSFIGNIDDALSDFSHLGAHRLMSWDLAHGLSVCLSKKSVLDNTQAVLVEFFIKQYQSHALPLISKLPLGVIHNDANDMNVLIDNANVPSAITGVIDFGDMVHSQLINDLAITCAYALMHHEHPIKPLLKIVRGYHKNRRLTSDEQEVLLALIALRLCVSVCHSSEGIKQNPENTYLLVSAKPAWALLEKLSKLDFHQVACQIKQTCGQIDDSYQTDQQISQYRQQHLSKNLSLSYEQPLKIIRGRGSYLYDEKGTAYLDMVNNVCHVGHCHPKVVAAGQQQMAELNTNTRYLHDNIVNYADKLLATMPSELSVCMFVNSGSEANELAFRLAKNFSKHQGSFGEELLVVDGAYHGNTNACIEASPYKFDGKGGEGASQNVHKVTLPDPFRGKYRGNESEIGEQYAQSVSQKIAELKREDKRPFAFICESLQGVAGQIIMPDGYLKSAYQFVRESGGVCIADEVQVGFGRVGSHMWAFETQGVVPDIVTLGKPIGNGHPLAAVITTKAIADAFVTGMEYFNTFGGNPVSCAIGAAVIDVIQQENLQDNAKITGQYFQEQLKKLAEHHDVIGDVRGLGLFIGVELVLSRETREPATELTAKFMEYFKTHRILLTSEGAFHNVFKIKPPIVFTKDNVDQFISVFKAGLLELS